MSRIDELIAQHCPDGVNFKVLGEVVSPQRGRRLVRSQLEESGRFAVYQNSMKPLGYYHESNTQPGATFVIVAGAAGEIGFSADAFWAADDVYFFPEADAVINKYLYHFLLTKQHEISSQVRRASVPRLSIAAIEKLKIPVPHLEVQREIVKVLDTFTKLEAELEAELEARRRQYQYYRDALLTFGERTDADAASKQASKQARLMAMSEVANIMRGKFSHRPRNAPHLYGGEYPFIQTSDVTNSGKFITNFTQTLSDAGFNASREFPAGTLTMAIAANVGDVSILTFDACFPDSVIGIEPNDLVSVGYLYHCLTAMKQQLVDASSGSAQANLNLEKVGNLFIPVPPLEEQARIVAILDKFDALVNDLSSGLPAEIKARRQQYEHYRDKLLSFAELEATA